MTKMKKILCVVTAIAVMFTMSSVSVLALDEPAATADDQVTTEAPVADDVEDTTEATEPTEGTADEGEAVEAAEETVSVAAAETVTPSDEIIPSAQAGYNSLRVAWNVDTAITGHTTCGATTPDPCDLDNYYYKVTRYKDVLLATPKNPGGTRYNDQEVKTFDAIEANKLVGTATYQFKDDVEGQSVVATQAKMPIYRYHVELVKRDTQAQTETTVKEAWIQKEPVKQAYVAVTLKVKKTLSSHGGKKAKRTYAKGTRIFTTGYGSAKYQFYDNGSLFYVMRIATKSAKTYYNNTKSNTNWYTPQEAENFVNDYRIGSNTGRMVWVSEYCQHAYLFTGSKGNWKCVDNWKVSTGKANTPSPTGSKKIGKRIKNRHGIKYWNCYSSLNALHGVKGSMGKYLGSIKSNGCVRNPVNKAQTVWNTCKKGTRILVY